ARGGARDGLPGRVERSARGAAAGRSHPRDARRTPARRDRRRRGHGGARHAAGGAGGDARVTRLWHARELSTGAIPALEVIVFTWYLWPGGGRPHPFFNASNALLILKYSSIYGIAAIGAAIVIISGGIDLAPGAVIALTSVVTGYFFVERGWPLAPAIIAGLATGVAAGLLSSWLIVRVGLPPFIATLGVMGIARGAGFIITEARYYDLSRSIPPGSRVGGVPIDWIAPVVMAAAALVF